jgi:hypothetical protein
VRVTVRVIAMADIVRSIEVKSEETVVRRTCSATYYYQMAAVQQTKSTLRLV